MTSKFNKIPLVIAIISAITVSYIGLWVGDGGLMVVFGVQGSIFWLFWLNVLNPLSKAAGNSAIIWIISTAVFWITIGLIGGKLCKKKIHILLFFLSILALTFLITLFVFRVMISGEHGSQIWIPMWPEN